MIIWILISLASTKANDRSFSIESLSRLDKVALVVSAGALLLCILNGCGLAREEKRGAVVENVVEGTSGL